MHDIDLETNGIFLLDDSTHLRPIVFTICIRTDRPEQTV